MQSLQARSRYKNSFWCAIHTAQEEGVRALWRGSTMRLARMSLSGGIVFTVVSALRLALPKLPASSLQRLCTSHEADLARLYQYEEITSLTEGL